MGIKYKDAINVTSRLHNQQTKNETIRFLQLPKNGNALISFTVRPIAESMFTGVFETRC